MPWLSLVAAARTGKMVNIKKGQFLSPEAMRHAVQKVRDTGNPQVVASQVCHGSPLSDPGSRMSCRVRSLPPAGCLCHALSALHGASFIETHRDPSVAKSDGANMLPLDKMETLLSHLTAIRAAVSSLASD